jgi:hypothetical protein
MAGLKKLRRVVLRAFKESDYITKMPVRQRKQNRLYRRAWNLKKAFVA